MARYRVLIADGDRNIYEDYIEVFGDKNSISGHGLALINRMEEMHGKTAEEVEFPTMYILKNSSDDLLGTELAFYELPPIDDQENYQYLFIKKQRTSTESIMFPVMVSLDDEDIVEIKSSLFNKQNK